MKLKKFLLTTLIVTLSLSLVSCLKFRSLKNLPIPLHSMYLSIPKNQLSISNEITTMLASLRVHLADHPDNTPITLRISDIKLTHTYPDVLTTQTAVNYTYTIHLNAALYYRNKQLIIGPKTLTDSSTIIVNSAQVYVPETIAYTKHELEREIAAKIFYWLSSSQVAKAVNNPPADIGKKPHYQHKPSKHFRHHTYKKTGRRLQRPTLTEPHSTKKSIQTEIKHAN